jgi:hypothetical protein
MRPRPKYRITRNEYLTVVGGNLHYNRHFEKGDEFEKEAVFGTYVTLINDDFRIWVTKDRLKECFELIWENTGIFKQSPYFTESDDGTEDAED